MFRVQLVNEGDRIMRFQGFCRFVVLSKCVKFGEYLIKKTLL
jgi:hypothetical protein